MNDSPGGPTASADNSYAGRDINVSAGLNEAETADLIGRLLNRNEAASFIPSLQAYITALKRYSTSAYQLTSFLNSPSQIELYVPLACRNVHNPDVSGPVVDILLKTISDGNRHIFIEGRAGSGKSTILSQIAKQAWSSPEEVGLDQRYLPLPLRLRSFSEVEGASRDDRIWAALGQAKELQIDGPRPPPGFFETWSRQLDTPWLFLLDGFDEVSEHRQPELIAWITKLTEDGCRFILTSRPASALPKSLRDCLTEIELQPFSQEQQFDLAEKWFGERAAEFVEEFKRFAAGDLGGTPLLITIAASVFSDTGKLPLRRSELYRTFVESACQEALRRAGPDELGGEVHGVGPALAPKCLQLIARNMTERGEEGSSLDFGSDQRKLIDLLSEVLRIDLGLSTLPAAHRSEQLLKFLGVRSGIFRASPGQYEWAHRTFREYLTAESFAKSNDKDELKSVIERCGMASWDQVILFLISIYSEHASVEQMVRSLKSVKRPYSVSLAGFAAADGANISSSLAGEIVTELCSEIKGFSSGWICNRLLTADLGALRSLRQALRPFMSDINFHSQISQLRSDLVRLAVEFGNQGACAIEDLRELGDSDTLVRITCDPSFPISVRMDAAASLRSTSLGEEGTLGYIRIAEWASEEPLRWVGLPSIFAGTGLPEVFAALAERELISDADWGKLLDALSEESRDSCLDSLASNDALPESKAAAVRIRLNRDAGEALTLIPDFAGNAPLLRACVNVLAQGSERKALLALVVLDDSTTEFTKLLALQALKGLGSPDELTAIMRCQRLPYSIRRRAAEAAYSSELSFLNAEAILTFFNGLPHADRHIILLRRAYLNYSLWHSDEAVRLLEQLFQTKGRTPWPLELYAHCLERDGKIDEALAKYKEAIALGPGLIFSRCKIAVLTYQQGDIEESANLVEDIWTNNAPDWFFSEAFAILRRARRPDQAECWIRMALDDPASAASAKMARCELAFDKGHTRTAIARARELTSDPFVGSGALTMLRLMLRATDQLEDAEQVYGELREGDVDFEVSLSNRADTYLRLGRFTSADQDIRRLRSLAPDEPFYAYLDGLSRTLQGTSTSLSEAALSALAADPVSLTATDYSAQSMSNAALYDVALGNLDAARDRINRLADNWQFDHLIYYTVPELKTLVLALKDEAATKIIEDTVRLIWPDGWELDSPENMRTAALQRIERDKYPFPMYCQRECISGLSGDRDLANRVFDRYGKEERAIVLWTLGRTDRLYGQCNFHKDSEAESDFKFCEEAEVMLGRNLEIFVRDFAVRKLLFLEADLLREFEARAARGRMSLECSMADLTVGL